MKNGNKIFRIAAPLLLLLLLSLTALCSCGGEGTVETAAHSHVFGKWSPKDQDSHSHVCRGCDETESAEHTFESSVVLAPTCTAAGIRCCTCTVCGYHYDEEIAPDPEGHAWSEGTVKVRVTCTEPGTVEYRCTVPGCSASRTETVPAAGHDYGNLLPATAPTCTEEGCVAHFHCVRCGQNFDESKELLDEIAVPAHGHTFGEWIPVQTATCTVPGAKGHYTCPLCHEDFDTYHRPLVEVETSLMPHRLILVEALADTCLADGRLAHYCCESCGERFLDKGGTIPVTEDGTVIPKGRHSIPDDWSTDADRHWRECEVCHDLFDLGEHRFDEGNITVDATAEHEGVYSYVCRDCGYARNESFPYDGKTKIRIAYKFNGMEPALRTEDGYTIGYVELTGADITVTLPDLAKATFPAGGYLASWSVGKHVYSPDTTTLTLKAEDLSDGLVVKITANVNRAVATIDFENKTVGEKPISSENGREICDFADFSRSGSGIPSVFTSEQDHTTGHGVSLRTELDQVWVRQKYYNIFDHLLTNDDIGRQMTVTFWLYSTAPVALQYGLMCPANTAPDPESIPMYGFVDTTERIYTPTLNYIALQANVWTEVTLPITVDEYMVGATCGELPRIASGMLKYFYYNPSLLSIIIDRDQSHWTSPYPFTGPSGKSEAESPIYLYVDDISVIETGRLDVGTHTWDLGRVVNPAAPGQQGTKEYTCTVCGKVKTVTYDYDPVVNVMDFDNRIPGSILTRSQTEKEVTTKAENASTNTGANIVVTDLCDHTSGEGNSISLFFDTMHVIMKLYNVFDHVLTEDDLGMTYRISFWVRTDTGKISLTGGLMAPVAWSVCDNPPAGWKPYGETVYEPTRTAVEADTEWRQYSFDVVVSEIMLSGTFGALARTRNGTVNYEYHNPALLGFTVSNFPGQVTLFVDDIVTTELGKHTEHVYDEGTVVTMAKPGVDGEKLHTCLLCGQTEIRPYPFDPVVSVIDFEDLANGKTLTNVQTGPEVRTELSTAITDSGQRVIVTTAEDHTTGTGKSGSMIINSGSKNPKVKFYNVFDHVLTSDDIGSVYRISAWVKTDCAGGLNMSFGMLGPSAWDVVDNPPANFVSYWDTYYQPNEGSTASIVATDEWQQISIEIEITERMLSTYLGSLKRTRNGTVNYEYHNPALFSFKVSYTSDCVVYIDDIVTTYVGQAD